MEQERFDRYREITLRDTLYMFRQRLHEPGMIFESQRSDVVDNLPVDIVNIIDSDNHVVTVHFHQSTKLPVRQIYKRINSVTKEQDEEVTLFARYRDCLWSGSGRTANPPGAQWRQSLRNFLGIGQAECWIVHQSVHLA